MALVHNKPNSLSYFKIRRVNFPCPHFSYIQFNSNNNFDIMANWIEHNLNSRYYIDKSLILNSNNMLEYKTTIGFESPGDLTLFNLTYPGNT